jgi:hypothetical protein
MNRKEVLLLVVPVLLCLGQIGDPQENLSAWQSGKTTSAETFRPQWKVGQSWIVETVSPRVQMATARLRTGEICTIRWKFLVEAVEQLGEEECFRVAAEPMLPDGKELTIVFWATTKHLTLRRVEIPIRVSGRLRILSESFSGTGSGPFPVMVTLSLLPLDLPCWDPPPEKHPAGFAYEIIPYVPERKAPGGIRFAVEVQQTTLEVTPELVKSALGLPEVKATSERLLHVKLASPLGTVEQLWQVGQPWPVWANNGRTVSRLVEGP